MSQLYSLKEIREILDTQGVHIPDGTMRNYRDDFMDLLPHQGQGRFARYHEDALGIFKNIRHYRQVLRLDTGEIRQRLAQELSDADSQAGETAPAPAAPDHSGAPVPAGVPVTDPEQTGRILDQAARTADLAANIDLRTRYLLDGNTRILSVLQKKYVEDDKKIQSLREELNSSLQALRRDQETLNAEIGDVKYLLKQVLSAVSERGAWRNKQDIPVENLTVEGMDDEFQAERKQRNFFDKLMKF